MGTPCGLKTVTVGTSATNLHFLLRPIIPPYYETMFKIMPVFASVNRRVLLSATYFAIATLIALTSCRAQDLLQGTTQTFVNIYCSDIRQTPGQYSADASGARLPAKRIFIIT
jgi:hypothetical protein